MFQVIKGRSIIWSKLNFKWCTNIISIIIAILLKVCRYFLLGGSWIKRLNKRSRKTRIFNFQALVAKNIEPIWHLDIKGFYTIFTRFYKFSFSFELNAYAFQELFNLCYLHNDFEFLKCLKRLVLSMHDKLDLFFHRNCELCEPEILFLTLNVRAVPKVVMK